MKRIKRSNIDHTKLITKSAYARELGVSPSAVDKMVNNGKLTVVQIDGAELIHR